MFNWRDDELAGPEGSTDAAGPEGMDGVVLFLQGWSAITPKALRSVTRENEKGGASGIGAACAATPARESAKVVVTDLDDTGGQAVVGKIGGAGGEVYLSSKTSASRRADSG
jgi:hypothetical protein